MTEQDLISAIDKLIDAGLPKGRVVKQEDIARRATEGCEGLFPLGAVTDLVAEVFTHRFEPWKVLPGSKPRLREWGDGVARLTPKPSALEILEAGRQSGEPLEVTLARANPTGDEFEAYRSWLRNRIEKQEAIARELKRVHAIAKPALDEDPSLTIGEALKVMASRGSEAARRELAS